MTPGAQRWLGIAALVVPPEDRAWLLAELEQLWEHRAGRHGEAAANAALRRDVMRFAGLRLQDPIRRRLRDVGERMGETMREFKTAVRSLMRVPGFAVVAVLTLGIGIGANALVFGLVDGVLLEDLPYPEADRIVQVWDANLPASEYDYIAENSTTLSAIGAYDAGEGVNLASDEGPVRLTGTRVTSSFLEILGQPLAIGGGFTAGADDVGGTEEVIISHALWTTLFGADPAILGRTLDLDGITHTVVGVLPRSHDFPTARDDVLLPFRFDRSDAGLGNYWGSYSFRAIGRLAPAATPEQATAELRGFTGGPLIELNPIWTPGSNFRAENVITPLREALVGDVRARLWLLVAVVGVVLLVVAANVGNLLLARGIARRRDMAVRAALGAGRGRLIRTHLAEGVALATGGAVVGLGLAGLTLEALRPFLVDTLPRLAFVSLDVRAFAATAAISVLVGLTAGTIAALRGVGGNPGLLLRDADRGATGSRHRLARTLVAAQIAAAVVLVIGAGVLTRDLSALGRIHPNFDAASLITARIDFTPSAYASSTEQQQALAQILTRLDGSPDLASATLASTIPFGGPRNFVATYIEGVTNDPNVLPTFARQAVTHEYFQTMGIPLLEGRLPTAADRDGTAPVAVVDEAAVRDVWGGESPIGDVLEIYGPNEVGPMVIGVVASVRRAPMTDDPPPSWYIPLAQAEAPSTVFVVARPRGGAASGWEAVRAAVEEVSPSAPVTQMVRYGSRISSQFDQTRFLVGVLGAFAGVTLLLGGLGVYGVTSYSVRQRVREFGVRVALGANAEGLRLRVVREGLVLAGLGALAGVALAIPAVRLLDAFLVRVAPLDVATFATVPFLMVLTTLVAVYVPARRATRIDPANALRGD